MKFTEQMNRINTIDDEASEENLLLTYTIKLLNKLYENGLANGLEKYLTIIDEEIITDEIINEVDKFITDYEKSNEN